MTPSIHLKSIGCLKNKFKDFEDSTHHNYSIMFKHYIISK